MAFSSGGSLFQPAQPAAPTTGGLFGTSQAAAPAFGFGAPAQPAPAFGGFGAPAQSGTAAPAPAPAFGGFGTAQNTTLAAAPAPTFSGFGAAPTSAAPPTFSGFGAAPTSAAPPTFGAFGAAPQTSSSSGLFGTGGFGGFGTSTNTASAFGSTAPAAGSFAGFGTTTQQQQQQQQQAQTAAAQQPGAQVESVFSSVLYCNVYGDERDAILARWNLLQAAWGTGKGYYSGSAPVQYTAENSLCRFKAIGYSKLPQGKNEDGIVVLLISKPDADVRRDQAQLVSTITAILGNKPNLNVVVESVSGVDTQKTEVLICVQERSATGAVHKAPAMELSSFLWQQASPRAQLSQLGVTSCLTRVTPSSDQLREYLATPPAGIDARIWKQAQSENPDPQHCIPIPLIGFGDLVRHLHLQEKETRRHEGMLDKLADELSSLQSKAAETSVALSEHRRRHIDLQHRVLKVLIKQECSRKEGFSLQPDEERLRVQLESIHNELSIPTQFRGRLNELLSQIRMRQSAFTPAERMTGRYNIEPSVMDDLKQVLKAQQEGMTQLMNILKEDFQDLHILENALKR